MTVVYEEPSPSAPNGGDQAMLDDLRFIVADVEPHGEWAKIRYYERANTARKRAQKIRNRSVSWVPEGTWDTAVRANGCGGAWLYVRYLGA